MFKIGEFARIAHISAKLLRYYDQIDLFKPAYVDPDNDYRFYHSDQLADLNRIIALKELDFSLEQIKHLMQDQITAQEIRGMLIMRKAQIERSLEADAIRLRHVETRLQQIEQHGDLLQHYDIVVKPVGAQRILATRQVLPDFARAVDLFRSLASAERIARFGPVVSLSHTEEFDAAQPIDLEIGFVLDDDAGRLPDEIGDIPLTVHHLPPCKAVASIIQTQEQTDHLISGSLGIWLENNHYQMAGPWREIYYKLQPHLVLEHQVPIIRREI